MQSNTADDIRTALSRRGRWGWGEIAFWLVAAATLFFLPERHLILNEIAIIGLFALSL
ncbi:branched-chain amino acid ABC transporter permease, partial [Escherichia coli]